MTTTTVVLARHGRTAWHQPTRYTGRSDVPLDEVGVTQAAELARWAGGQGFAALACSHLVRARQTAAAVDGLTALVDPRLRELDFGVAEGHTLAELRATDEAMVARFEADPVAGHFPGGEPPGEAAERGLAALHELAAAHGGQRILVVAHSTLIRLVVCAVLGVPLSEYRRRLPVLDPAATVTLRFPEPVGLLSYNVSR
ncbi:phosphoglycerate mutase [Asanoa ishikariensis]|uniref:Probable phosphoglycerate mutase n=1 Tax=Asanoa ishikariensis TaxID=137265 RepID=A0A1H3MWD1_9ACTN|nr:histidine phosphatase family protein [Asanoa ishikariensis]GIF66362.1 phosphoglycerate mutase [Asanoa ishikariensis]SDY80525.1 probable phosphoglycerate mutase [Asanoa ishikariensis]